MSEARRLGAWIGLSALLTVGCASGSVSSKAAGKEDAQAVGDFRLRDLKGHTVRLSDHAGKVVLVSFWASWCEPCQIELPQLQDLWKKNRDRGFELLTISVDTADKEAEVRQLVRRYRYEFPVLLDQSSQVTDRFHPTMELPYSMLLDRRGHIVARHQGYRPGDEEVIAGEVEKLLAEPAE